MFILNWNGTHGTGAAGGQPWALRIRPDVGFDFDTLGYSMGGGSKTINTQTLPLTSDEVLRIEQWITAQNPHQTTDDVVHGADAAGRYLGLVPQDQAAFVLPGPPPGGDGWRWVAAESRWSRDMSLPEAQAQALQAIDAAADAIYKSVLGARSEEYQTAKQQAQSFIDSGHSGDAPPSVAIWAQVKGQTAQWAAHDILATATQWEDAMQAIRAARLQAKETVRSAIDGEVIHQTVAATMATLAQIRQSLGLPSP